ncbi:chromosome partitioning protein ParA [Niastella koreensis]|uniref:Cobyrinic acid ac-diamide synthase n=2 Tax=Niastella koreensis TaxID=354356 RepID=G8T9S5_NIAKG|nr:AAA family ATPase [Niastella koreensis]AEW00268.1 Cobyrinic acid ac-diamide synthase [Niastella koreensis GR20-10]OQP52139.1 chromosome partitioning protein ParA [Niastella koreensis]
MAQKIVYFNHKGGVSKTTTTYNLGWMLAEKGKKVLLVDADPQCNLTALILNDNFEQYYLDDATKNSNIKDGVKVAFEGKPLPIQGVACQVAARNPNLYLLPGHANLSEYDAALSFAQTSNNAISTLQNLPGAFNDLLNKTAEAYGVDYVFIDLNPGLSAINQNLFVVSDYFVIPTNPDPFSIMAINTLVSILPRWVDWAKQINPLLSDAAYPLPDITPKMIGTIIQRFNIRKGKAAKPYRENIEEIKQAVQNSLKPALQAKNMIFPDNIYQGAGIGEDLCLDEIPDFQGLLPKANDAGVPVFALEDDEIGETGSVLEGMIRKRDTFYELFDNISNKIISVCDYGRGI